MVTAAPIRGVPRRSTQRGFTLVEMIAVMAVLLVLGAMVFPSIRLMRVNMTVTGTTNDLVAALNLARSEAVKRGRPVAVLANGGDWSAGWQVVAARRVSGVLQDIPTSPGDEAACSADMEDGMPICMRHQDAIPGDYPIHGAASGGGEDGIVLFGISGELRQANSFDLNICRPPDYADEAGSRRVTVAGSGAISSKRDTRGSPAGSCA